MEVSMQQGALLAPQITQAPEQGEEGDRVSVLAL